MCNVRRKVSANFETDIHKLTTVVNRYQNILHVKDEEVDLKFTEHRKLLIERRNAFSFIDILLKPLVKRKGTTFL